MEKYINELNQIFRYGKCYVEDENVWSERLGNIGVNVIGFNDMSIETVQNKVYRGKNENQGIFIREGKKLSVRTCNWKS